MKKFFTMVAVLFGMMWLCACSSDDDGGDETAFTRLVGTWRVDSTMSRGFSGVYTWSNYPKGEFTLTFGKDGSFSASGNTEMWSYNGFNGERQDGGYYLEVFSKWDKWSRNSIYDDNEIFIQSSGSYSGDTYDVTYSDEWQKADAVLWRHGSYPQYYLTRIR